MHIFLTLVSWAGCLVLAAACWYLRARCDEAANEALESAQRAEGHEVRLKVLRSDVSALSAHVQVLEHQLAKVSGRVYATMPRKSEREEQIERDNIAAHMRREGPDGQRMAGALDQLGTGIAAPNAAGCTCGWCATCKLGAVATN